MSICVKCKEKEAEYCKECHDNRRIAQEKMFRKKVLRRDNYTCQDCEENDKRCLTVHHKDKENHPFNPDYAKCLCYNCQAKIHRKGKFKESEGS